MVGFKSNLPTFFVSSADGAGTTGKIGIGNITDPQAKLHLKADAGEDAALLITPDTWDGNKWAELRLGNNDNSIRVHYTQGLIFKTENNYLFNSAGASFGIGVDNPSAKLEVNGNILQKSGFHATPQIKAPDDNGLKLTDQNGHGISVEDGGNVVISTDNQNTALHVNGILKTSTLQIPGSNPDGPSDDIEGFVLLSIDNNGTAGWRTQSSLQDGDWTINGDDIYRNVENGNVGIGTDDPTAKLDVGGKVKVQEFQLLSGAPGLDKLLRSDAEGNASWADPPLTDDGDWVISGDDNIYRADGNVGIGTDTPVSNLHIQSDVTADITTAFLIIENDGEYVEGSGITTIGKRQGSGPMIIQKAGIGPNFTDGGPRLCILQKSKNNINGLSLSTYTTNDGEIDRADIYGGSSDLFVRANHELNFRSTSGNINFAFGPPDNIIQRMQINASGQVGIGTTNHDGTDTKLTVAGTIHAQEVKVTAGAGTGADFVFESDYDLPAISEVETFIKTNKHLPDIPSADEMVTNGIDVGKMQIKLLQKIEELTLYVIELKRENEVMRGDNAEMKFEIEKLKRR